MAISATSTAAKMGALSLLFNRLSIVLQDNESRPFYDCRNYYKFPYEYREIIDEILINAEESKCAVITSKIIYHSSKAAPGKGYHYYYSEPNNSLFYNKNYIIFYKIYNETNGLYYYMCYVYHTYIFDKIMKEIFISNADNIRTIYINPETLSTSFITKVYNPPYLYQKETAINIISKFKANNNNLNVIICGERGSGKTTTADIIKKILEEDYKSIALLFNSFNPFTRVNYISDIASRCSKCIFGIVVIDELDRHFVQCIQNNKSNSVSTHAQPYIKNEAFMLDLLDNMDRAQNCINIFTTEKSIQELYNDYTINDTNVNFHSFLRKGRVDLFVCYEKISNVSNSEQVDTNNDEYKCVFYTHKDIIHIISR